MIFDRSKKKYLTLTAEFIGKDRSCGFRNGRPYILRIVTRPGYLVVYANCGCCPYTSWEAFFANWNVKIN